jgi:hypothetical protein
MISLLENLIANILCWFKTAIVESVNGVVSALAAVITFVLGLLPNFPAVSLPSQIADGVNWLGYWFPVTWFLANMIVFLAVLVLWWGLSIPLRWARATRGSE